MKMCGRSYTYRLLLSSFPSSCCDHDWRVISSLTGHQLSLSSTQRATRIILSTNLITDEVDFVTLLMGKWAACYVCHSKFQIPGPRQGLQPWFSNKANLWLTYPVTGRTATHNDLRPASQSSPNFLSELTSVRARTGTRRGQQKTQSSRSAPDGLSLPRPLPAPAHHWLRARTLFFSVQFRLLCTSASNEQGVVNSTRIHRPPTPIPASPASRIPALATGGS
jgi:hypothetical protein